MSSKQVTHEFAKFVSNTQFSDLPNEVTQQAKDYILDSIGASIGSYGVPEGVLISKLGDIFGAGNEGTILANGRKTSVPAACFANCKLGNFIDADETLWNYFHIGGVPVFCALNGAEKVGCSGKEFITAVVLAYEFAYRFCRNYALLRINDKGAMEYAKTNGYGFTCMAGAIGASKVLNLGIEEIQNAMGIAGYYTPLPLIPKWVVTQPLFDLKYQDLGWHGFVGLVAALFSERGYRGDGLILDDFGEASFSKVYGMLDFDFEGMVECLGEKWGIMEMGIKPYPCCRWYSTPIYMLKTIMRRESLRPDDIGSIIVKVHPGVAEAKSFMSVSKWHEWEIKDAVHSQYSLGHTLACGAYNIPIGPQWQLPANLTDPKLIEFSKKVKVVRDDKCEQKMISYLKSDQPKGKLMAQVHYQLEVITNKGTYSEEAEYIYGDTYDSEHSLSRDQLIEKFVGNCSATLTKRQIDKIISGVYNIDACTCMNDFTALFA